MAHARGGDANEHLPGSGRLDRDGLDAKRRANPVEDRGARFDSRRRAHATRYASRASKSGSTPRPGPGGGAIVPSGAISSGAGRSQSRRSGVQAGGVERNLDVRTRGHGHREVEVSEEAESVRPGMRRPGAVVDACRAPRVADTRRFHLRAPTSACNTSMPPCTIRSTRLRRAFAPSRRRPAASASAGQERRVSVDVVHRAAAPRASRRRAARGRGHTARPSPRPSAARGRPASPALVGVHHELDSGPTLRRTSSTTSTSCRQSSRWKRSLTALTPWIPKRRDALRAHFRLDELARRGVGEQPLGASTEQPPERLPGALPTRSQTATSSVHGRPPWKSTVSQSSGRPRFENGSTPTSSASEQLASGRASPLAQPVRPSSVWTPTSVASTRSRGTGPRLREGGIERERVAQDLDARDSHVPVDGVVFPPAGVCRRRSSSTGMWQRIRCPGSTSASGGSSRLADRRRACAGSACGTRSRTAARRRSGSRPRAGCAAARRRRSSGTADSSASV